jgi:hypothetical protein
MNVGFRDIVMWGILDFGVEWIKIHIWLMILVLV